VLEKSTHSPSHVASHRDHPSRAKSPSPPSPTMPLIFQLWRMVPYLQHRRTTLPVWGSLRRWRTPHNSCGVPTSSTRRTSQRRRNSDSPHLWYAQILFDQLAIQAASVLSNKCKLLLLNRLPPRSNHRERRARYAITARAASLDRMDANGHFQDSLVERGGCGARVSSACN
jgi:hypothetical protein